MPSEYENHYEAFKESHKRVEDFEGTLKILKEMPVYRGDIEKRIASQKRIQELLGQMKAKETQVIKDAERYAAQDNPDNAQMYLEAYQDYFDFLATQENVPDEQVTRLVDQIDALETLLNSQQLRTEAEKHPVPEDVMAEVSRESLEYVRTLYIQVLTQKIADLGGMVPEGGFKDEDISGFWREALARYKDMTHLEAEEAHPAPKPAAASRPATRVIADPGWTGWYKPRSERKVSAARGMRSNKIQ